jgi:hypothetical protein
METLFGYTNPSMEKGKGGMKKDAAARASSPQYITVIDSKKAQNLSILLKALNVTLEEVRDALLEGFFSVPSIFLLELHITKGIGK